MISKYTFFIVLVKKIAAQILAISIISSINECEFNLTLTIFLPWLDLSKTKTGSPIFRSNAPLLLLTFNCLSSYKSSR